MKKAKKARTKAAHAPAIPSTEVEGDEFEFEAQDAADDPTAADRGPVDESDDDTDDSGFNERAVLKPVAPVTPIDSQMTLKLTASLLTKLKKTAQEEGVGVEALAAELLSEGVVLRAWEIIERKNTMRGGNAPAQQGGYRPNNPNGNHRNDNRRGNRHGNNNNNNNNRRAQGNNNWMEDKAAFLEYVRNQEKRRR